MRSSGSKVSSRGQSFSGPPPNNYRMGLLTKNWIQDLLIIIVTISSLVYITYGTWVFKAGIGALIIIFLFYQYMFLYWRPYGIPYTSPHFPMGDITTAFFKAPGEVMKDLYDQGVGHRFMGVWFLFRPAILLRDPELIKQILVKEFATFHERGIYSNEKSDPLSAHIFSMKGKRWRSVRTKLTPAFTSGKMKAMFPQFISVAKKYEQVLLGMAEKGEVIDVKEWCARYATDLTTLTAFGIETHALTDPLEPFRKMGKRVFQPSFETIVRNLMPFLVPNLASIIGIVTTPKAATKFFRKAVQDIVEYREKNDVKREDFMGILVDMKKKGQLDEVDGIHLNYKEGDFDTKFTLDDVAAEAFVFYVAGFETAAVAMNWAIYELAVNPSLQKRARDEIHSVLGKYNGEITYSAVQEMKYLDRILEESLRMYPPVPLILRKSSAPYKIPGTDFNVPIGTQMHISVHGLHRDPEFFPNPDIFDPERFTDEEKAKRHHYAYLPFGEGPRNCFGLRYSMMQKKVGLIAMLDKFEFSLSKMSPLPLKFDPDSFVFMPKGGMWLKIDKINDGMPK